MISSVERQAIESFIHRELCRSFTKHGDWNDLDYREMYRITLSELNEVHLAIMENDLDGEHGAFSELAQVAACCQKLMMQIIRRGAC